MNFYLPTIKKITSILIFAFSMTTGVAQTYEWRLSNVVFNSTDPDAAGPATGSVQFTMQLRLESGTGVSLTGISTGYSWQSTAAMIPTIPSCATVNSPANITLSSAFSTAGFVFNTVNQCNSFAQSTGGRNFDRTVAGTLENGAINIGSTFTDVFTVTLWTLGTGTAEGGYGIINSSNGAALGALSSYALSDADANEYIANSLTFATPIILGSSVTVPVNLTTFNTVCVDKGTMLTWITASEQDNARFEIERSKDGLEYYPIASVAGGGNSDFTRHYKYTDNEGGAYFYRLKQVDFNGDYKRSATIKANCISRIPVSITVYPVPAFDRLNVNIKSDKPVTTTIQIFDAAGRTVRTQKVSVSTGMNTYSFDVDDLPSGQYLIRSADQQLPLNQKFTIAR
jgi:hypothetical protein